jgi:hypothetical protein
MKNPVLRPSYERAGELMAAGCPIDYPGALPRHSFRAEQLPGHVESCVYALGPIDTGYVIALRLATDRPSGTIITHWSFELPWPDHDIVWGYEPEEVIPKEHQEVYRSFFKSRLRKVLEDRHVMRLGYPVDGLLCGRSYQPVGESSHGFISAKLSFTDYLGNTVGLRIDSLNINTHSKANWPPVGKADQRLRRHPIDSEGRSNFARQINELGLVEQVQGAEATGLDGTQETRKKLLER